MSEDPRGGLFVLDGVSLEAPLVVMVCRYSLEYSGSNGWLE